MPQLKIIFTLLILCVSNKAQCNNYFDSLRLSLIQIPSIDNYDSWLNIATQINHDSIISDLNNLKKLAVLNKDDYSTAIYNRYYAANYTQVTGDYQRGLELALQAKAIFSKQNNLKNIIQVNLQIALFKLWNEIAANQASYNNSIYNDILAPTEILAKQYKDTNLYVQALDVIGSYWIVSKKDYNKALSYLLKAEQILPAATDSIAALTTLASIAIVYAGCNNEMQMLHYLAKYKQLSCEPQYLYGTGNVYRAIAKYYFNNNNYSKAIEFAHKAYTIAVSMNQPEYLSLSAKLLYKVYLKIPNKIEALKYLELHTQYEASMNRTKFEIAYEVLNVESKEKTILEQKYNLQKKNVWLIVLSSILVLGALLVYLIAKIKQKNEILRLKTQEQQAQLKLDEAVRQSEEDERKRISQNLHDSVVQKLVVLKMNMQTLAHKKEAQPDLLNNSISLLEHSTKEIRTLSHSLMPVNIESEGLANAVKEAMSKIYIDELKINVFEYGNFLKLSTHAAIITFRVIQECLQNALKHAMATEININMHCDDAKLEVSIEDNGIGFNVANHNAGYGINNMYNRIETLGGKLEFESVIGRGTLVIISVPVTQIV
jgi:two-component system, NarL family, sensor kinase